MDLRIPDWDSLIDWTSRTARRLKGLGASLAKTLPQRLNGATVRTTGAMLWQRFRRGRMFVPVAVTVPLVALSGGVGGYAAWDSTRVDVPDVVGLSWPVGVSTLEQHGLTVDKGEPSDPSIGATCYRVVEQDVPAGTRVVPDDTVVALAVAPDLRTVPDTVGMSLAEARDVLLSSCFHEDLLPGWCVPEDFSGGEDALIAEGFTSETGFSYSTATGLLRSTKHTPADDWVVCDQDRSPATLHDAASNIGLAVTVPLTTVPEPGGSELASTLSALLNTEDGCRLSYSVKPTFTPGPAAIKGMSLPPATEMNAWQVRGLSPAVGHAALCGSTVVVEVEWPSTPMPQLIGLHHVPETASVASNATAPAATTPATAALEGAKLTPTCSGKGTVTGQVPSAGTPVPVGTTVTCVAELVVPNIVGLDPATANAVLVAAGLSGSGWGSGIVVSQSVPAGTVVSSAQSISYTAETPRVTTPYAYYENCTEARAAGAAPLYYGEPGYRPKLDRDGDGIACE